MSKILVKASQAHLFTVDDAMTITEYFTKSDLASVSLVTGKLNGLHGKRRNQRSAKLYYVVSGELVINLEGRNYELYPGDALLIRPGEAHTIEGRAATIIMVCAPAFDVVDEIEEN